MATCAQLQTWLAAAETALHEVTIGKRVQMMMYGSKSITYTQANVSELRSYVTALRDQVAACTGTRRNVRRRIGIIPV